MDEEFEKLKNSNLKSRRLKVLEEIQLAEGALQDSKVALKKSEEQVRLIFIAMFFHSTVLLQAGGSSKQVLQDLRSDTF